MKQEKTEAKADSIITPLIILGIWNLIPSRVLWELV